MGIDKIGVVLVDDHEVVRDGLFHAISTQGDMEVLHSCSSADGCLEFLKVESRGTVVILDVAMSGLCPFNAALYISKMPARHRVLFYTGYPDEVLVERAMICGAYGFCSKSQPISSLFSAIKCVFGGEKIFPTTLGKQSVEGGCGTKNLSAREVEVLRHVADGCTAKEIGSMMDISARTAERHKTNIMDKLDMHTQVELARFAIREGVLIP